MGTNIHFSVEDYVRDYEFRGEGGDYKPTEAEQEMLVDAIHGAIYSIGQPPAAPVDPCPYAIDGCVLEKQEVGPCLCANPVQRLSAATGDADEYEKRIREKLFNSGILTSGEWVYLVGLFQTAREHEDCGSGPQTSPAWRNIETAPKRIREFAKARQHSIPRGPVVQLGGSLEDGSLYLFGHHAFSHEVQQWIVIPPLYCRPLDALALSRPHRGGE